MFAPTHNSPTSTLPTRQGTHAAQQTVPAGPELVCPAGSFPALKAAVDAGADCVYLGLRDATNARNFAGLNFDEAAMLRGIDYAHHRRCKAVRPSVTLICACTSVQHSVGRALDLLGIEQHGLTKPWQGLAAQSPEPTT